MPDVVVYTSDYCPYCDRAKALLAARGVPYEEIRIARDDFDARMELAERTGRTTVPQIFIGGVSVGGFDDLHALDGSGRLAEMLSQA